MVALLTAATAFACPSIYEPLGIVNLEAMACETAVVATATGGIPEVVVARRRPGVLVPIEQATDGTGTPLDPDQYVADFAAALTEVVSDPDRAAEMGRAGRAARDRRRSAGTRSPSGPSRSTARCSDFSGSACASQALQRLRSAGITGRPVIPARYRHPVNKNMFLLWGDDLATTLHDPALHERLAGGRVRRLQLNVDDEPVAAAMRIPTSTSRSARS